MKNKFVVVVDAFAYDILNRKIGDRYVTPFLRNLTKDSMCAEEFYSNAPYTEASLVSVLGGERTLENGGYLFGNRDVKSTIFSPMKDKGVAVLSQYSPYVYSKAYLRDVDEFWYTRLYSIWILFSYRFKYYVDKKKAGSLDESDISTCQILLEEALDTWLLQIDKLLNKDAECALIQDWVDDTDLLEVKTLLTEEIKAFNLSKSEYVIKLLETSDTHKLLEINKIYNKAHRLAGSKELKEEYEDSLVKVQKKYLDIIKRDKAQLKYLMNTLITDGFANFKGLIWEYKEYHNNNWIGNYLSELNDESKVEASIKKQLTYALNRCKAYNDNGKKCITYIHVQDFHLPSVFHSFDLDDREMQRSEIDKAIELSNNIDDGYKGNLLADLSAYYVDNALSDFFDKLKNELKDDFEIVITADHGFPSFFNPPRPYIYNQTYKEAFHVPFIYYNGDDNGVYNEHLSMSDLGLILEKESIGAINSKGYTICEYAGPGCPDIYKKDLWYTYIDSKYLVSVECKLSEDVDTKKVKRIFDLEKDPLQKNNLLKRSGKCSCLSDILCKIQERHLQIRLLASDK